MKLPTDAVRNAKSLDTEVPTENFKVAEIPESYIINGYGTFSSYEYIKNDQKAKTKFIRYVETMARHSMELKNYIEFLKENVDMQSCAILNGVEMGMARIELHHFPFTLFDIARIVVDKALANESDVSSFRLVEEIVRIHYEGIVGLIPLSETVHELAHAGKITLALGSVSGNWKEFVKRYAPYLTNEDIDKLKFLIHTSSSPHLENENRRKLKVVRRTINIGKTNEPKEVENDTRDDK